MNKQGQKRKRIIEGVVVSDKMEKTIVIKVNNKSFHPVYKKIVLKHKKFKVHDVNNSAKIGDKVRAVESRPYSKDKHFCLLNIVK
ncbi:MAG: 30S ribosomal protein S17 [Candidatus Omnitrophota bacterium]